MPSAVTPFLTPPAAAPQSAGGVATPSVPDGAGAFQAVLSAAVSGPRPAFDQIGRVTPGGADGPAANSDLASALRTARLEGARLEAGAIEGDAEALAWTVAAQASQNALNGAAPEIANQIVLEGAASPLAAIQSPGSGSILAQTGAGSPVQPAAPGNSEIPAPAAVAAQSAKASQLSKSADLTKAAAAQAVETRQAGATPNDAAESAPARTSAPAIPQAAPESEGVSPAASKAAAPDALQTPRGDAQARAAMDAVALADPQPDPQTGPKRGSDGAPAPATPVASAQTARTETAPAPQAAPDKAIAPERPDGASAARAAEAQTQKSAQTEAATASEAAAAKRAASGIIVEPLVRDARGASDAAAARAPGELIRAAVRDAGPERNTPKLEAGVKTDASAPASAAANSAPSTAAAPVAPGLAAAMMTAAPALTPLGAMTSEPGGDEMSQGDLDLTLDQGLPRADARADVQRQALPSAANAHAAARFQPQTVHTLAARIAARAADGGRVFDIRLDPAELGRVDVRLEMGADNSVRALLSAERADTLAELQRSARDLEKALAEAGLDLAEDGLSFSLSDDGAAGEERDAQGFDTAAWTSAETLTAEAPAAPGPVRLYGFDLAARSGLDVRI